MSQTGHALSTDRTAELVGLQSHKTFTMFPHNFLSNMLLQKKLLQSCTFCRARCRNWMGQAYRMAPWMSWCKAVPSFCTLRLAFCWGSYCVFLKQITHNTYPVTLPPLHLLSANSMLRERPYLFTIYSLIDSQINSSLIGDLISSQIPWLTDVSASFL